MSDQGQGRLDIYAVTALLADLDRVLHPFARTEDADFTIDPNVPPPLPSTGGGADGEPSSRGPEAAQPGGAGSGKGGGRTTGTAEPPRRPPAAVPKAEPGQRGAPRAPVPPASGPRGVPAVDTGAARPSGVPSPSAVTGRGPEAAGPLSASSHPLPRTSEPSASAAMPAPATSLGPPVITDEVPSRRGPPALPAPARRAPRTVASPPALVPPPIAPAGEVTAPSGRRPSSRRGALAPPAAGRGPGKPPAILTSGEGARAPRSSPPSLPAPARARSHRPGESQPDRRRAPPVVPSTAPAAGPRTTTPPALVDVGVLASHVPPVLPSPLPRAARRRRARLDRPEGAARGRAPFEAPASDDLSAPADDPLFTDEGDLEDASSVEDAPPRPVRASASRASLGRMLAEVDRGERATAARELRRKFSDRARWRLR